jgi:hypothetical protein
VLHKHLRPMFEYESRRVSDRNDGISCSQYGQAKRDGKRLHRAAVVERENQWFAAGQAGGRETSCDSEERRLVVGD